MNKKKKIILIVIIVVIALALIIGGIYLITSKEKTPKKEEKEVISVDDATIQDLYNLMHLANTITPTTQFQNGEFYYNLDEATIKDFTEESIYALVLSHAIAFDNKVSSSIPLINMETIAKRIFGESFKWKTKTFPTTPNFIYNEDSETYDLEGSYIDEYERPVIGKIINSTVEGDIITIVEVAVFKGENGYYKDYNRQVLVREYQKDQDEFLFTDEEMDHLDRFEYRFRKNEAGYAFESVKRIKNIRNEL